MSNAKVYLDTDLDEQINKTKEILNTLKDIDNNFLKLQFISIKDFMEITGWSEPTVQYLFNKPDFPCTNYGKEKKAEIHAIINYFSVPRRK